MNESALNALESHLPQVFPKKERSDDVDFGDVLVVDGDLFETKDLDEAILDNIGKELLPLDAGPESAFDEREVNRIQESLLRVTAKWSGARTTRTPWRRQDGLPPPDCFAAYFPWHHFGNRTWGIYLLVEGVVLLARYFHRYTNGVLTLGDSEKIAKAFLFHHEAYHNAVEAFAARNEVSWRVPFYIAELERLYQHGMKSIAHEEALATAYAMQKVSSIYTKGREPDKHAATVDVIRHYVSTMPPPYSNACTIWDPKSVMLEQQHRFAEQARAGSTKRPTEFHGLWEGFPHAFRPSLVRNGRFTWLIPRNSPLSSRIRTNVRYFSRRDFIAALKRTVGGQEVAGGRHPHWQVASGQRVPVPGHRELDRRTCREILKQLGIKGRLEDVMGAN